MCIFIHREDTEETKAMPQWLRAGHRLLQASRPFLRSNFKTSLIRLNLRQKQTALLADKGYSCALPVRLHLSFRKKRETSVTTGFPCQQFLQHRRLGSHFSSIFWPREKGNFVQKQSKWEHVSTEGGDGGVCVTGPGPTETAGTPHALDHKTNSLLTQAFLLLF